MKMFHVLCGKKSVSLFIFLMLVFSLLSLLSVNVKVVSAVEYPSIIMEPYFTDNKTLGENLTISIRTDYNGTDIFSWGFTLTYNPLVLNGVNVTNGDLITKDKNLTATFIPGTFDNTEGKLGITAAGFFGDVDPTNGVDVASGPGTLANVTFTVVGYGKTNITFGRGPVETFLQGWNATPDPPTFPYGQVYLIVDAAEDPDNIQDSSLINIQNLHTVGVPHIAAPSQAVVEHSVDINVTVVNGGNFTENGNVALYNGTNEIGNTSFTLNSAEFETFSFSWNTSGLNEGFYTLNATATISGDEDLSDNNKTAMIELKKIHDVVVLNVSAPTEPDMGEPIAINVTITNNGSFDESVNVTLIHGIWDNNAKILRNPTLIDSQVKSVLIRGSALLNFSWDAAGLDPIYKYTLNATATISENDTYPDDNWNTAEVELVKGHDVAVTDMKATSSLFVGQSASINVTVKNNGLYTEASVNVTLSYRSESIDNTLIDFQVKNISKGDSIVVQFSWNTSGFAPGTYYLNATATISGDGRPTDNKRISLILVKGGRITGVVTDALYGNPVQNVSINAGDYSAVTNINGTYNITDVLPGKYDVTASATGYESASQLNITVIAEAEPTTVNFELIPFPGAIIGTVVDALTGEAIVGATLTANGYNTTTDAYGHYNITDVPHGTYTVTTSATEYEGLSQINVTVFPGKTATVNFTLRAISTITISAEPTTVTVGEIITINASLTPIRIDVNITILYRLNGEETWTRLANVTANESGQFVHVWKTDAVGTYEVKAEWLGDEKTSPAEDSVQVKVEVVSSDIFLYLAIGAAVAGVSGLAIAVYLLKIRKPT